jgi:uncharacterized membrane protein YeaQ/YmgE (transglycosylase-associated protein family)
MKNGPAVAESRVEQVVTEARHERWAHLHVNWTAVWSGALAAFCMVLLFGLIGIALGAHLLGPEHRVVDLKKLGMSTLILSVCGAFFAFVVGGWVAGKIAGILHSEPAMLHGALVWLLAVPILVLAAGLGAASLFGGWFAGLSIAPSATSGAGTPFARPDPLVAGATADEIATYREQQAEYVRNVKQWNEDTPKATRNSALGAVTALLLGLMGAVIGGWMASGEPMNFSHYRTRTPIYHIN